SQWPPAGLGDAYDGAAERQRSGAALGQIAQPEDVADAVMSLLEGSKLVTGQTLVVDGGALLGAKP
ncbi:MAG: SDR family oxidoreductase, partial [Verrucomicrobiales bacterium]